MYSSRRLFFITNFIMQPCQSYFYKTEVVVPSKVSQFVSSVEERTNVVHSEGHLGGYSNLTGGEGDRGIQSFRATEKGPRSLSIGLYRLGVPYG